MRRRAGNLLARWLTHPSRYSRRLRGAAAIVLGAASIGLFAAGADAGQAPALGAAGRVLPTKLPAPPAPGDPVQSFPSSAALAAEGYGLYERSCSSCHGIAMDGIHGVAPSLRGVGAGPVDFYLSTGRMPLEAPREEPARARPLFDRHQIDAIIAYVSSFGGPPAPKGDPAKGDLALGLHEFTLNCAGCHQIVARGGLTLGAVVPDLQQVSAQQTAEAVRMGPYLMPRFDAKQIDQHQLDSIVRYVLWTRNPNNAGGWGIYNLGPIPEGMVAWFLALMAMVIVARLIGERTT
ncbi:MAG: c-type cytochrome [Solirubrobacteraceae bacterium]